MIISEDDRNRITIKNYIQSINFIIYHASIIRITVHPRGGGNSFSVCRMMTSAMKHIKWISRSDHLLNGNICRKCLTSGQSPLAVQNSRHPVISLWLSTIQKVPSTLNNCLKLCCCYEMFPLFELTPDFTLSTKFV